MTTVHPDLIKKAHRMILKGEARLTEEQKPLWAEVFQKVGREEPFLLVACLTYILKGAKRPFILKCIARNYALPLGGMNGEEDPRSPG